MKKFLGVICFIAALLDVPLIIVAIFVKTDTETTAHAISLFNSWQGYGIFTNILLVGILLAFFFFMLWAGIRLFRKTQNETDGLIRVKKKRVAEKVILILMAVSLAGSAISYFIVDRKNRSIKQEFKHSSAETVLGYINEMNAYREKKAAEIAVCRDDFQNKFRADFKERIKEKTSDKTPLMIALMNGASAEDLFSDVNDTDDNGMTALMLSLIFFSDYDTVKTLLDNGADVKMKDSLSRTALMYAAIFSQDPSIIDLLISGGSAMYYRDIQGKYPIHLAAQYNNSAQVMESIIKNGGKVNDRSYVTAGETGTPLAFAVKYNNNPEIISLLLASGAVIDNSRFSKDEYTDIFLAAGYNNSQDSKVLKMILDAGGNPDKEIYGMTFVPLSFAAVYNGPSAVETLIKQGADMNIEDKEDVLFSPVMAAAYGGNAEIIQLFINNGADMNIKNLFGMSALDIAAANPQAFEIIELLKENGVMPGSIAGTAYPSVILVCAVNDNPEQIEKFIENNADFRESANVYTPFAAACRFNRNPECLKVFLKHGYKFDDTDELSGKKYGEFLSQNRHISGVPFYNDSESY